MQLAFHLCFSNPCIFSVRRITYEFVTIKITQLVKTKIVQYSLSKNVHVNFYECHIGFIGQICFLFLSLAPKNTKIIY